MTVSLIGFNPELVNLIQQNTLQRVFLEALIPRTLWRSEAQAERWEANVGEVKIFTRAGTMPVNTDPLKPGEDPTPKSYGTEQFKIIADQYGDRTQTHMPTSRAAIASKFALDTQKLGENAGLTMNRLVRNRLYTAYTQGDTVSIVAATTGASNLRVANLNGFLERLKDGALVPVSPASPIPIELGPTGAIANSVIAAIPDDTFRPTGPGTLVLSTPLGADLGVRSRVRATHRARILRSGGAATIDGINASTFLTVNDIIQAVQLMRSQNVPPHPDGRYHVHVATAGVTQLFLDTQWTGLRNLGDIGAIPYRELLIGEGLGCYFYQNNETPDPFNSGVMLGTGANAKSAPSIGAEVVNETNVPIARTIVTGGGAIYEHYIPEDEYTTIAGVNGQVGSFNVTANGVIMNTDRVRYIIRRPMDVLQQIVDHAWSWSGDFPIPTDVLSGNGARVKRAVIIEHTGAGVAS